MPEDMETIAYLKAGELTKIAIDIFEKVSEVFTAELSNGNGSAILSEGVIPGVSVAIVADRHHRFEIVVKVSLLEELPDLLLEEGEFGGIELLDLVVLIDKLGELSKLTVGACGSEWRRHVVDDDGVRPSFGLSAFARIIDDEGIDERKITEKGVRIAGRTETKGFPGKPFERSMFAKVNDGVNIPALRVTEPAVESVVVVRWGEIRLMVDEIGIHPITTWGLEGNEDVAQLEASESDVVVVDIR